MKLIFLDYDGVICTNRASEAMGETGVNTYLDPIACKLIERLITDCSASVVISSDWRLQYSKKEMIQMLKSGGHFVLANSFHSRWSTPDFIRNAEPSSRGHEIEASIAEISAHEEVEAYVILDDVHDFLEYQQRYFVECNHYNGIGYKQYIAAKAVLEA